MTKIMTDLAVLKLSMMQRAVLIDHIDGAVELIIAERKMVRVSLMQIGLLRAENPRAIRPRATVLTEQGRRAVGIILGDYADALVRAGILEQENPLQVLLRLKAARSTTIESTPAEAAPRIAARAKS